MKKEIKFSLVYRDMFQSSGKFQPLADQLEKVAPAIIEMGCFSRVETNGGAFEQYGLLPLVLKVCEYSNDGFDTVMSWAVCQTFYIASYIITKNKYDEQQIKQMQLKNKQR